MSKQGRVYRHGDAWAFDIDVGPSTGQRNRKRGRGFSTKREATAASEAMRSRFVDVTDPTTVDLGTYLDEWLDQREASHAIAPTTVRGYRLHTRKAHELLPGIPLDQLTAANLDHAYRRLLTGDTIDGRRLSNRSVRAFYTTIHKALKDGVRKGMVSRNVAALSNPPSTLASSPKVKHNHWSIEEVQAFLAAGRLPAYRRAAWCLALGTGLRRAELCGLEWGDVDFDERTLTVERTRTPVGHEVIEGPPKTARGYRTMSISDELVTVLRRWKVTQGRLLLAAGRPQSQVLTNERLTPWHPSNVSSMWRSDADRAVREGIVAERMTLHGARRWNLTQQVSHGVDPLTVSKRAGHHSPAFTLAAYGYTDQDRDRAAAAVLGNVLGAAFGT
jgi:integrase